MGTTRVSRRVCQRANQPHQPPNVSLRCEDPGHWVLSLVLFLNMKTWEVMFVGVCCFLWFSLPGNFRVPSIHIECPFGMVSALHSHLSSAYVFLVGSFDVNLFMFNGLVVEFVSAWLTVYNVIRYRSPPTVPFN